MAELERNLIADRTRSALAYKKDKGEWAAGRVPFGFQLKDGVLVENPSRIRLIKKAKALKRAGVSLRAISQRLNVPKSTIHRALNTDIRRLKSRYVKG